MPAESLELTPNPSEWALLCPRAGGPRGHRHEAIGAWWLGAESEVSGGCLLPLLLP